MIKLKELLTIIYSYQSIVIDEKESGNQRHMTYAEISERGDRIVTNIYATDDKLFITIDEK